MMSNRLKAQRLINKRKREESSDDIMIITPSPANRQRTEPKTISTIPNTTINVPDAVFRVYQNMLPDNPEGIAFLFSSHLSEAVQVTAARIAIQYNITKEEAIEEFRRLIVIKAFTVDVKATKISPTPLSKQNNSNPLFKSMLT